MPTTPIDNSPKTPGSLTTPSVTTDDMTAQNQSLIDNTQKMLQEQAWLQQFSIEANLRSEEVKILSDALKGIIQKMS